MAFSVYEVVHVACLSRGWFATSPKTSHANDFVNAKSHGREKHLIAGYRKVCIYVLAILKAITFGISVPVSSTVLFRFWVKRQMNCIAWYFKSWGSMGDGLISYPILAKISWFTETRHCFQDSRQVGSIYNIARKARWGEVNRLQGVERSLPCYQRPLFNSCNEKRTLIAGKAVTDIPLSVCLHSLAFSSSYATQKSLTTGHNLKVLKKKEFS